VDTPGAVMDMGEAGTTNWLIFSFLLSFAGLVTVAGVLSLVGGLELQNILISVQHRLRVSQVQKSYGVGIDVEIKAATPTMGGVAFIVMAFAAIVAEVRLLVVNWSVLFWSLPVTCGAIGFWDDWLKVSRRSSEGFSSLGKLAVQVAVASIWVTSAEARFGLFAWRGALDWPGWLAVPLTILGTVGMMNAVNVTDGLDGLAGGAFLISLGVLACILKLSPCLVVDFAVLLGTLTAFLFYNIRPARIFMGDTGSHFLGGALVMLCVEGGAVLALIPAGFIFGLELLSSAVQIIAIRGFGRKVFRMAPLHHHFQRMGWDETKVTGRFLAIHAVGASLTAALCVLVFGR
jgi:phospho-N-acetylmuramoyl-pentapeptide-transferase